MMTAYAEIIFALFLLIDLWIAGSSRLLHCIQLAAAQGVLLGVLPLVLWQWSSSLPELEFLLLALVNIAVKGWLLPSLLKKAMYRAKVRRELEPLVGYAFSLCILLGAGTAMFFLCGFFKIIPGGAPEMLAPVSFTTMFAGLFIVMARRKAITQVIGFLIFENGITMFGLGISEGCGVLVELGILLDVFVLVFVMGITVFQISREFSHIDADRLNQLNDNLGESGK